MSYDDDYDDGYRNEILVLDDDDDYRNRRRRPIRRPSRPVIVRPRSSSAISRPPIVQRTGGGLSTGQLIEAGAQVLAALKPLPPPPTATSKPEIDIAALIEYQKLLAQHAKQDEQLRTIGSLASKFFA